MTTGELISELANDPQALDFYVRNPGAVVHRRYTAMRLRGESHNMAEMLALRKFPGVTGLDADFMRGRMTGDQFSNRAQGEYYHRIAEEAGVSTAGKYYSAPLASYPGDPSAWVSDRSDVLRVARAKGLRVEGLVDYSPPEHEPSPDIPVAADILERHVQEEMEVSPGVAYEDVRERVFDRLTGAIDNNPLLVDDHVPCPVDGVE